MMMPKQTRSKTGPEETIQNDLVKFLTLRQWYCKETHGNMYQSGFPDIYATHYQHGVRWIEVKLPDMKGSKFTPAQMECFPKFNAHGTRIWILTAATEAEYKKLFLPNNLWQYMGGTH